MDFDSSSERLTSCQHVYYTSFIDYGGKVIVKYAGNSGKKSMSTTYLDRANTHILIIDDDDRIRDLLSRYLTKQGYRASTASGASEARQKMQGLKYDLLIVDIMMPDEDGLTLTRSLRKHHDVPIILLTALGEADQRIAGLRSGADDYLPKPFEPEELLLRLMRMI